MNTPTLAGSPLAADLDAAVSRPTGRDARVLGAAAVFLVALAIATFVLRPIHAGPVAADAAASVLYWDRLVSGQQLEAFVNTTPKPLLTVVYGLAWTAFGDWRAISVIAIVAAAACAGLSALLAWRVAGPAAALVAGIALATDTRMLAEVSWTYGLPAALAFLAAAGLALTGHKRRYVLAGAMLLLSCLVRPESFLVLGIATIGTGWAWWRRRVPSRTWGVLLGWAALPLMLLHDVLLTGDPLYWLHVSGIYADGLRTLPADQVVNQLLLILAAGPLMVVAAVVGFIGASRTTDGRIVAIGTAALAVGTAALVVLVATMGRQTLGHYYNPIWSSLEFAAALGVGFVARAAASRVDRSGRLASAAAELTVGAFGGLLVIAPLLLAPDARETMGKIADQRRLAVDADAASEQLRPLAEGMRTDLPAVGADRRPDGSSFQLLVPRPMMYRLAVDLDLPLTVVGPLVPDRSIPDMIHPGLVVFHDRIADAGSRLATPFERPSPVTVDGVTFDLLVHDPPRVWIWQAP